MLFEFVYAFVFTAMACGLALKLLGQPKKRLNSDGYIVLNSSKELEHRQIAKQLIGRELFKNEVVHHINGRKDDNHVRNLCLMDRKKHELFHSWLRWKKEKNGYYPKIVDQKKILANEYNGVLLEKIPPTKFFSKIKHDENLKREDQLSNDHKSSLYKVLKEERKRIASERNIKVYMVFNNQTLYEISQKLPNSYESMLEIKGVGPVKMRMYGDEILNIVSDFKKSLGYDQKSRRDIA